MGHILLARLAGLVVLSLGACERREAAQPSIPPPAKLAADASDVGLLAAAGPFRTLAGAAFTARLPLLDRAIARAVAIAQHVKPGLPPDAQRELKTQLDAIAAARRLENRAEIAWATTRAPRPSAWRGALRARRVDLSAIFETILGRHVERAIKAMKAQQAVVRLRPARSWLAFRENPLPAVSAGSYSAHRLARSTGLEGAASHGGPTTSRYFFHIHHADPDLDEVGTELPDVDAARAAAASLAHRLLLDDAEEFWRTADWSLEVKDETGRTVFALWFQQGVAVQ